MTKTKRVQYNKDTTEPFQSVFIRQEEHPMTKVVSLLMMATLAAGCVTANSVGSKPWHTERIAEIDASLDHGEISQLQRRELKEEADKTRDEYRKERRLRYKQAQLSRRRIGYFRRPSFRPFGYRPY